MAYLFKYPDNYINPDRVFDAGSSAHAPEVSDNDFNTSSALTSLDIHVDTLGTGMGDAKEFTHIFIKSKGVGELSFSFTDGNLADVSGHTVSETLSNGRSIVDVYDFQNILYKFVHTATPEAKTINLTVTPKMGATVALAEIMVLRELFEFDLDMSDMDKSNAGLTHSIVRGNRLRPTAGRGTSVIPPLNGARNKNKTDYTLRFTNDATLDAFMAIVQDELELVFAPDPLLYPRLVYPATIDGDEIVITYEEEHKLGSRTLPVTFMEL